jgi:hypothetical protein
MSTIAQDGSGNIAVGYDIVDENDTFPGARYTGREFGDPLGTMPQGELFMIDGSAANPSVRWGDYNSINVDPVDDCTFWFTSNYSPLAQWRTRVAVFRFDSCTGELATPTPTEPPTPTPTETPAVITEELLENIGFENLGADLKPDIIPWVVKNLTGDKGKCNKDKDGDGIPDKIYANSGECAFRFKGVVGENTKLAQTFVPEITDVFVSGDTLDISLFYNGTDAALDASAKLIVKYSDATEKGKVTIDLSTVAGYTQVTAPYTIQSEAVSKIKVQVNHKTPTGKLLIDDTSLIWTLSGGARGILIPMPQDNQLRSSK